jgi:hypothetical protein
MANRRDHPECPHCGYDLSGAIGRWEESCPLKGTCSECGGTFWWGRVLRRRSFPQPPLFDDADAWGVHSFVQSLWRSVTPWKLWREARLDDVVRARRLAVFTVVGLLLMHLALSVGLQVIAVVGFLTVRWALGVDSAISRWLVMGAWPYGHYEYDDAIDRPGSPVVLLGTLLWPVIQGALSLALGDTRRELGLGLGHCIRIAAYSLVPVPLAFVAWGICGMLIQLRWDLCWIAPVGWGPPYHAIALIDMIRYLLHIAILAGWCWLCWSLALSHLARAPRPWALAAILTVGGGVGAAVITMVVAATVFAVG